MNQYDLWWAELPEPVGTRPVLLLTRDGSYDYLQRILVVEVTTKIRGIPQEAYWGEPKDYRGVASRTSTTCARCRLRHCATNWDGSGIGASSRFGMHSATLSAGSNLLPVKRRHLGRIPRLSPFPLSAMVATRSACSLCCDEAGNVIPD